MYAGSWLWSLIDLQTFPCTAVVPVVRRRVPVETAFVPVFALSFYGPCVGVPVPRARCEYGPHSCGGD